MREQPIIGATSRHLRIFIDVNSTMTRIPFNLTEARQRSALLIFGRKMTHLVQNGEGNAGQVFVPPLPPNCGS